MTRAHAFGVKQAGRSLADFGDLSVLSFHVTKAFNTFEGGAIISYFSINELDYSGTDVAKALNISRASVSKARVRGKKLIDENQYL